MSLSCGISKQHNVFVFIFVCTTFLTRSAIKEFGKSRNMEINSNLPPLALLTGNDSQRFLYLLLYTGRKAPFLICVSPIVVETRNHAKKCFKFAFVAKLRFDSLW